MKLLTVCSISIILCIGTLNVISCDDQKAYSTKYDNIDLDEILNNQRLLKNYVKCVLDEGPCTPDGKELKDNIRDAIQSDCEKCSDTQKYGSEKVIHYLIDNDDEDWKALESMYDPEGKYKREYLESKNKKSN